MTGEFHKFASYTRRFFSSTLLSRISGLFRDIAMAAYFGENPAVASFMVAFRFSQFFRRIFGEGSLQSTFIPHYEALRLKSEEEASHFFQDLTRYLSLALFIIIILSAFALTFLTKFPRLQDLKEIFSLTVWMLPSLLFVCLYALNTAALQCHGIYFLGGIAPVFCNLLWILGAYLLGSSSHPDRMFHFSLFVTVGFILQWFFTLSKVNDLTKLSFASWFNPRNIPSKEIKNLAKAFLFATLGIGATQINSTLDALFAHYASVQGPIYLWYAIRLEQLPMGLFAIALVSAITPTFSRVFKEGNLLKAEKIFLNTKERLLVLMLFFTGGILAMGIASVSTLFYHGRFTEGGIWATSKCLFAYSFGLIPASFVLLYCSVFYASSDFKTPMRASLFSVGLNLFLNSLFVFGFNLDEVSIALSTSLCNFFNFYYLKSKLKKQLPLFDKKLAFIKPYLVTLFSTLSVFLIDFFVFRGGIFSFIDNAAPLIVKKPFLQLLQLFFLTSSFISLFLFFSWILRYSSAMVFFKEQLSFRMPTQS